MERSRFSARLSVLSRLLAAIDSISLTAKTSTDLRPPWSVVLVGFVTLAVAGGIGFYVFPVYMELIRRDLDATLTQVTFGILLWGLVGAAASPFAGRALHRFGVRPVMLAGTLLQVAATLLLASAGSLPQLYAALILSTIANVGNTALAVSTAVAVGFVTHRGRAMGIALLGLSAGGLMVPLIADRLLVFGWRTGYLAFAGLLVALLPVLWLGLDRSRGLVRASDPAPEPAPESAAEPEEVRAIEAVETSLETSLEPSLEPRQAFRTRTFWVLGIGDGLTGLIFAFLNVHLVTLAIEGGVARTAATTFFSAFLFITAPGTLLVGALADRWPIRRLMLICYAGPVLVLPALLGLPNGALLGLFVVVAGLLAGGRVAAFPLAIVHGFGPPAVATVGGWLNVAFMTGTAFGPVLAGVLHDRSGSYQSTIYSSLALGLISVTLISLISTLR